MQKKRTVRTVSGDIVGLLVCFVVFVIPFLFMLINSLKERREANRLSLSLPEAFEWSNFVEVFQTNDYQILTAFKNSIILTVGSCAFLLHGGVCDTEKKGPTGDDRKYDYHDRTNDPGGSPSHDLGDADAPYL